MNYGKNLTGEKKGTFTSLDVTGNLNIDNDGSFLSSGNILSSGSISASPTVILKNFMHIDSMVDRGVLITWNLIHIGFIKQKLLIYQCRMHVLLH